MNVPAMKGQAHILYRDSLLDRGLAQLLSGAGVRLHKIDLKGAEPLEMLLGSVQPGDTVLMERQGKGDPAWEQVLRLLSSLPAVALIVVDLSSSQVQVFLQQQSPISSPEELAEIIRWWGERGNRLRSGH